MVHPMVSNALYFLLFAAILFIVFMAVAVFFTYLALKYLIDYEPIRKIQRRGLR